MFSSKLILSIRLNSAPGPTSILLKKPAYFYLYSSIFYIATYFYISLAFILYMYFTIYKQLYITL